MKYFISDLHFFDAGIIYYCDRPFASVEEMHRVLVGNFNRKVAGEGEVYVLGDIVGMKGGIEKCGPLLKEMGIDDPRTPFRLIRGNHDLLPDEEYLKMGFVSVEEVCRARVAGYDAMLAHDPCMIQPCGTLAICGHIHTLFGELYNEERNMLAINVGVERRGYAPVSEAEIAAIVEKSRWRAPETAEE